MAMVDGKHNIRIKHLGGTLGIRVRIKIQFAEIRVRVSVGVCAVHVSRILKCRDRESLFCMLRYNIVPGPYLCTRIFLCFPCVVSVVESCSSDGFCSQSLPS